MKVHTVEGAIPDLHNVIGECPTEEIIVKGRRLAALVDTGSQVTLMTQAAFRSLQHSVPLQSLAGWLNITAANGSDVPYDGVFWADVEVRGVVVPGILVQREDKPTDPPVLLGMNVLGQVLPPTPDIKGIARLAGKDSVYVPLRSAASVRAIGVGNHSKKEQLREILVEPFASDLPKGLIVPPTLTRVHGNIPMQVVNVADEGIFLKPRTCLGTIQVPKGEVAPGSISVEQVGARRIHVSVNSVGREKAESCPVDLDGVSCSERVKEMLQDFIQGNADMFFQDDQDLGYTDRTTHSVHLRDDIPVASTFRRIPPSQYQEVKEHIQLVLDRNITQKSSSPYAAPVVVVRKKNNDVRLTIDYRKLNAKTIPDAFPLPRIDDSLDALGGARMFSTLDLASGYHQVAMSEQDRHKTAFITPFGLFEYLRMPMGLSTSPATFQRLIQTTMNDLAFQILLVYLDDLLIYSRDFDEHLKRLKIVFDRLREVGLKLNPKKCFLARDKVEYLGYTVSADGTSTSESKIRAVKDWPIPRTLRDLRSWLGFASYYRTFVPSFSAKAKPLNELISKMYQQGKARSHKCKTASIVESWDADCQAAFQTMKEALTIAPVLAFPQFDRPFILETDARLGGLGAVLSQEQEEGRRVIAYASRSLRPGERNMQNYSSMKLEMLALKWAMCEKFRHYLLGTHTRVYTDDNPLSHLQTAKLGAVEQRWASELACFDFSIKYRSGRENANADALSRCPVEVPEGPGEELRAVSCSMSVDVTSHHMTATTPELAEVSRSQDQDELPTQEEPPRLATPFPTLSMQQLAQAQQRDRCIAPILPAL